MTSICHLCDEELKEDDLHQYYNDELVHTDCVIVKIEHLGPTNQELSDWQPRVPKDSK